MICCLVFSHDFVHIKECHAIVWKTIRLFDRWRFWGFTIGFVFNLISVVSGLFWTSVSYLLPTEFEDLDLFGGLVWTFTDTLEIVQICDA